VPASVRLTIDTTGVERSIEVAPRTTYYWFRRWLTTAFWEHRKHWLATKKTSFGRGKDAIKVWGVNKAPAGAVDPKHVVYRIAPIAEKFPTAKLARRALPKLKAEAFGGSVALGVHELGTDISVPNWLAIPMRTRPRSPKTWRAKYPGRVLITREDKDRPDRLWLMEVKRYRGRRQDGRQPAKGSRRKKVVRYKLIPRFVLVKKLDMKPTLNFIDAWSGLASARQKDFASICSRIASDVARGKL
jgi:hypothetical protein